MRSFDAGAFLAHWVWILALLVLAAVAVEVIRMAARYFRAQRSQPSTLYLRLRERALHVEPPVDSSASAVDEPFALVTDVGYAAGTATILTTKGGDASIYFSRDGSYVRSHGNPSIGAAARWTVEIAGESTKRFHRSERFPLARDGEINFYLISADGIRSARTSVENVSSHPGTFTNLFAAVKRVLLSFRSASRGEARLG
jgi:hypothetical protein